MAGDHLCKDNKGDLFIDDNAPLERSRSGDQELLARAAAGGFEVEVVGNPLLAPGVLRNAKPGPNAIAVLCIKVGRKTYAKWDDDLQYYPINDMPIGEKIRVVHRAPSCHYNEGHLLYRPPQWD